MNKNEKPDKEITLDFKTTMKVSSLMSNAFEDYIASRNLILQDYLPQGLILANTAIEKYFKSLKALLKEPIPRHHDITVSKIQNTLKNKFRPMHDSLNQEFLEFLSKGYKYRYIDELESDFNIAVIARKTLAELDFIVSMFEESIFISTPNNKSGRTNYRRMKSEKDEKLLNGNYLLKNINKDQYIKMKTKVWEFRKLPNGEYLQVYYDAFNLDNDGKFLYEAFKPNSKYPCSSFNLIVKTNKTNIPIKRSYGKED